MENLRLRDYEELKRDIYIALKDGGDYKKTRGKVLDICKGMNVPEHEAVELFDKSWSAYNSKKVHLVEPSNFVKSMIYKWQVARIYERESFLRLTNDTVIDQKMAASFMIKNYELYWGIVSGVAFGGLVFCLPNWGRHPLALRLFCASIPFSFNIYRGFRRGYDHIDYHGKKWSEVHLRRKELIKHLRDHDDFMPEFKQWLVENGKLDKLVAEVS